MRLRKSKNNQYIYRITVDEKLEQNLIRLLIASLKQNVKTFNDDPEYWNEEEEILVHPDTYQYSMGMTLNNAKKWGWDSLYEGQVFLVGAFKTQRNRNAQTMFVLNPGRKNFRRIDSIVRENIKKKYLRALQGGVQDGKAD